MGIITAPEKPVGREQKLTATPVAVWGKQQGIPVLAPEKLDEVVCQKVNQEWEQIDAGVVAAYGQIIPKRFLDIPRLGCLNIHPSLLPAFRGASPVAGAIVAGKRETGVTVMKVDEKLDHGPIGWQEKKVVGEEASCGELTDELFKTGAKGLIKILDEWEKNEVDFKEQDEAKASFTRRLTRQDGFLPYDWLKVGMAGEDLNTNYTPPPLLKVVKKVTPRLIYDLIRGLAPWPGIWTEIEREKQKMRLKILKAGFSEGKLQLKKVQLEGKKPVEFSQFREVYPELF